MRRIVVRYRKERKWGIEVIISALEPETVLALANPPTGADDIRLLLAYV